MRPEPCHGSIHSAMAFAVGKISDLIPRRFDSRFTWCMTGKLPVAVPMSGARQFQRMSFLMDSGMRPKASRKLALTADASCSIRAWRRLALQLATRELALASLLLISAAATAGSLGQLTLQSAFGESLKAEIKVVALRQGEAETLGARIASPEAFREAGVDYAPAISSVRASIRRREGNYYVVLTSTQPINEPFLDVARRTELGDRPTGAAVYLPHQFGEVQGVERPVGNYRRRGEASRAAQGARAGRCPGTREDFRAATIPITPPPAAEATPSPMAESCSPTRASGPVRGARGAGGTYEVVKGDTLSEIAVANLPDGISVNQMLVALYRANETAFINNNMNLVRAGTKLTIPSKEGAIAVASEEATKVVSVQAQEFDQYRGRVAAAVAMAPARGRPGPASGKIETVPPAPLAPKRPTEDQLRLSGAEPTTKAGKTAARDDDLAARERELKEARERVSQLEQNVKAMERLLELKNQQLAELQKQAAAASAAPVMIAAAAQPVEAPPASSARPAPPPPSGKQRDHRESEQRDRERSDTRARAQFADRERVIVREYYMREYERGHCPPGLARKHNGCMSPGQEKKWRIGHPLSREVIFYDLPPTSS